MIPVEETELKAEFNYSFGKKMIHLNLNIDLLTQSNICLNNTGKLVIC